MPAFGVLAALAFLLAARSYEADKATRRASLRLPLAGAAKAVPA